MIVADEMVEAAEAAVYSRHERGFLMKPLVGAIDMRAALSAALAAAEQPVAWLVETFSDDGKECLNTQFVVIPSVAAGFNKHYHRVTPLYARPVAAHTVAVEPLKWRKSGNQNGHQWQGQGAMGFLAYISDVGTDGEREGFYSQLGQFDTLEQAKSAAQQDFEARIRSALVLPAQTETAAPSQDSGDNGRLSIVTQKGTEK